MDWAAVGFDKSTGYIQAVTACGDDKRFATKTARYYRSVGYKARVMEHEELREALEKERAERMMQRRMFGDAFC